MLVVYHTQKARCQGEHTKWQILYPALGSIVLHRVLRAKEHQRFIYLSALYGSPGVGDGVFGSCLFGFRHSEN